MQPFKSVREYPLFLSGKNWLAFKWEHNNSTVCLKSIWCTLDMVNECFFLNKELNTPAALELVLRCHLGPRICKIEI